MEGAGVKFKIKADLFLLRINCLKAESFESLPRMLKPLDLGHLKDFYRGLAKKLGGEAVEK